MANRNRTRTAGAAAAAAALVFSAATLVAAAPVPSAAAAVAAPKVSVLGGEGAYRVEGSFRVETPLPVAWAVLTDYDHLSSFVSSMRSSMSYRDESGRRLVVQKAVGRAGPFSRTLHVILEVTEQPPGQIAFRDVCGGSFVSYEGAWTIDDSGGGVLVTYVLDARPRSSPPFFARSILASNARGLLEEVRREMQRRGRTAS
jgi:carbon monoxide dehydrogenase subunit G